MLKKIFKRFEKSNPRASFEWAKKNTTLTIDEYCKKLDPELWLETKNECLLIQKKADTLITRENIQLGGGANIYLLYFMVRKFLPKIVLETGVSAGFSSLAILRAFQKNSFGKLYSSDFPYFRIDDPLKYIGILIKDETNKNNCEIYTEGDEYNLKKIIDKIGNNAINLFHYDSDKSYSGRKLAINIVYNKLSKKNGFIIFDDIQDNFHFKDFVICNNLKYEIMSYDNKYLGLINLSNKKNINS